ncbi:hypothetical protein GCM10022393_33410 [Aquimarina addita]|uniref:Uncharacterized protein n=1 Tax=Aquimarina addita TaxID=870485 RepID=A0ABP6UTI6_9FLAO
MKRAIVSILISLAGFFIVYKYHYTMYIVAYQSDSPTFTPLSTWSDPSVLKKLYTIVIISVALLSLYLGIISFLKKNKIGLIAILVAILLFITPFVNFF